MWLLVNHTKPTNNLYGNLITVSNYKSASGELHNRRQLQNNFVNGAILITINRPPRWNSLWWSWGGFSTKKFHPMCVNKESSTERHSYNRQVNRSPQLQCQDLNQHWIDKIRKAFSSRNNPLGAVQFANICPCGEVEQPLRLVRRKVAILRAFTVGFQKALKRCLLLLVAFPGLIDFLLHSC